MPYGLSNKTIDQLTQLFGNYDQINEVLLYGSRATGTYNEGSDIDLVLNGKNISFELLQIIKSNIDDLLLPYIIDLTTMSLIKNKNLLEHINPVGIIFYTKQN